jgi:hypothetical protein
MSRTSSPEGAPDGTPTSEPGCRRHSSSKAAGSQLASLNPWEVAGFLSALRGERERLRQASRPFRYEAHPPASLFEGASGPIRTKMVPISPNVFANFSTLGPR